MICPVCNDDDTAPRRFRWWHPLLWVLLLRPWYCWHCYNPFVCFFWRR